MNLMKKILPTTLLLVSTSACSLFGGSPGKQPAPMAPAQVEFAKAHETAAQITWNLTCVVPENPVGGPITACDWSIQVNGTLIENQPANGLTAVLTIEKPLPGQTTTVAATVRSIRRGLVSATGFTKTWDYTTPDVAPPAPLNIGVTYAVIGDSLQVNLTCAVAAESEIETCEWTGAHYIVVGQNTSVTIPNGLTTAFKIARPEPAQTVNFVLGATAVRRGLRSTAIAGTGTYTTPDVAPPAPNEIIIQIVPDDGE